MRNILGKNNPNFKYDIPKQFLIEKYIKERKSSSQIAKILQTSRSTIFRNLQKFKILKKDYYPKILTKDFLQKEYLKNKKSTTQIAIKTGIPVSIIHKKLIKYSIKIRNQSQAQKGISKNKGKINHFYKDNRTNKEYYCKDCHKEITFASALYGDGRCSHCSKVGELSNHWQNGKSFEEYPREFNKDLKIKIRKRDNYTCQKCGITEEEHLTVYGRVLDVHHIDYNKQNCNENNLITLCNECNLRVNFNRKYWKKYFKGELKCSV